MENEKEKVDTTPEETKPAKVEKVETEKAEPVAKVETAEEVVKPEVEPVVGPKAEPTADAPAVNYDEKFATMESKLNELTEKVNSLTTDFEAKVNEMLERSKQVEATPETKSLLDKLTASYE